MSRALLLLILVSCNGPAPYGPCTAVNCKGCCDATGVCNPGTEPMACGLSGATCVACPLSQTCAAGACIPGSSTGGGSATAGGTSGTAGGSATAGGSSGTAGGSATAGGSSGTAGGLATAGGGTGTAGGGSTGTAGGGSIGTAGGGSTGTAGGGSTGTAGGGSAGTAGGGSGTAGGSGGTAGGSPSCGPGTCTNGCCSTGACRTPIPAACGHNGAFCAACTPGQSCTGGTCGYTGNTYAGSPCATNNDCTLGGVFGTCRTGNSWPGGYCQDTCYLLSCNGTDVCISQDCWERCSGPRTGQSTCRGGYVCGGLVLGDGGIPSYGICRPSCQYAGCTSGTCGSLGYCQ